MAQRQLPTSAIDTAGPDLIRKIDHYTLVEPESSRGYTVLRLETNSGIVGYGECGPGWARNISAAKAVRWQPATAVEQMRNRLSKFPAIQAGVNMALLDIVGKMAKAPVYQVLGGPTRHKVRVMAPLYGVRQKRGIRRARAAGHRAFLVEMPTGSPSRERQAFLSNARGMLAELRAEAGEGTDFVLDGRKSGFYRSSPGDAASIAAAMEKERIMWFDEPCPVSNLATLRKVSGETVTPIGLGWNIDRTGPFQDLLREGLVDVLRPDLGRHGVTQIRRLAALAETYYVAVAPSHHLGPIGTAAALHLAASIPNFFILEMPSVRSQQVQRMRDEIVTQPVETVEEGFLKLPTGPGLGVEVNEEAAEKYKEELA